MPGSPARGQLLPRTLNFTKENYKAHNQNWMIAQSPEQKMYFGNTEGLLQYDGLVWKLFQLPHHQAIRSVVCDKKGRIFTGAFGDFGYWEADESGLLNYHSLVDSLMLEEAGKEEIWHIFRNEDFVIFQSFSSIFVYDYQTVKLLKPPGNIMYAFEANGTFLVQVIDSGIYRFSHKGHFELIPSSMILADKKVMSILPFGDQAFLAATANGGVYLFRNDRFSVWENEAQQAFKDYQLNKGVTLSNGQLAFGTILDGLYILNENGKILTHINQKSALQNNTVLALFEDHRHNLWCGLDKGIDLVELNTPLKFFIDKTGVEGTVYAACKYEDRLYLGTNQGLFVKKWNAVNDFSAQGNFKIVEGSQGQVWELRVLDGQLVCGHNEGTFLVQGEKIKKISNVTGGFAAIEVPGKENILLQGTYTGVVVFSKDRTGQWVFDHRIDGFLEPVKNLFLDAGGYLWVANPIRGLHRLELSEDFKRITSIKSFAETDGLPDNFNVDMALFNDTLLFKSGDRYHIYDSLTRAFKVFALPPFDSEGFKVRQFGKNDYFKIFKNKVEYFDGKQAKTFNLTLVPRYETILQLEPGLFMLCLDDGFALLDKKDLNARYPFPGPAIEVVEVFVKKAKRMVADPFPDNMAFSAQENDLRFYFFQPVFTQIPELIYQLEGYDSQWYDTEGRAFKEFTNLPAGKYVFRIKSLLTQQTDSFSFSIRQKWYKSAWILLIYLGALSLFGIIFYQMHLRRLKKERQNFEAERERVLREQEIKSNNEKLSLKLVNKTKELANSTMGLIRKNETLQQVKNELIKIRKEKPTRVEGKDYQKILHLIDVNLTSEQDWEIFETNFSQVHEHFFKKLKEEFPELTPGDLKLAAYLKMNLTSKEIAPLLNISIRGVENKRYRLRMKIGLPASENLTEFMIHF